MMKGPLLVVPQRAAWPGGVAWRRHGALFSSSACDDGAWQRRTGNDGRVRECEIWKSVTVHRSSDQRFVWNALNKHIKSPMGPSQSPVSQWGCFGTNSACSHFLPSRCRAWWRRPGAPSVLMGAADAVAVPAAGQADVETWKAPKWSPWAERQEKRRRCVLASSKARSPERSVLAPIVVRPRAPFVASFVRSYC